MRIITPLMAQQHAAVEKVFPLRVGALFMEMGTGKTLAALELIARRRERISRVLWFCPVSLKESTYLEILKHAPDANVALFDEQTSISRMPKALIYLIGIESMSASDRVILAAASLADSRSFIIVDESSYIKGHRASRTKWITRIGQKARYRLLLTGTPISQGVIDLYSQMRFLSPKILGYNSFYTFSRNHLEYSDKHRGMVKRSLNEPYIAAKIAPYVYQVTKEECLDLPEKIRAVRHFSMTRQQRWLYEEAKEKLLLSIEDREIESRDIFHLFTALQQITCGFWNHVQHFGRDEKYRREETLHEVAHNRLDLLKATIGEIPAGEKVIIWAKYRRCITEIAALARSEFGDEPALFYGDLNEKQRAREIERFRLPVERGGARFFVATPSSGGHGLTLNESNHVIFYTDGFKYSERLQAEDRNHRIGQNKRPVYISLVCNSSIDERIQHALQKKGDAVEEFREEVKRMRDKKTVKQAIKAL